LRYAIDTTKIKSDLGWEAQESFESGLGRTVDWYLSHPDWVNAVRSGAYRDWIQANYQGR
jgi:dTDP-glucose 4,6-dehydratase